jgi:hypothetical protein
MLRNLKTREPRFALSMAPRENAEQPCAGAIARVWNDDGEGTNRWRRGTFQTCLYPSILTWANLTEARNPGQLRQERNVDGQT